jgi:hypothetical protein
MRCQARRDKMAAKNTDAFVRGTYPLGVSTVMIVAAVILSLVDLTFLNDVIGKVLDFGPTESMLVAFALGLVGVAIMAHQGIKAAHGDEGVASAIGHYSLWIALGAAFVLIRLFSASILQLDGSTNDESLVAILGLNIRQVDLVLSPLMFFLYIATGLMVKDGFKHLLLNPDFDRRLAIWKQNKEARTRAEEERRKEAEDRVSKVQARAEESAVARQEEIEEGRVRNALNGNYSNALVQFRAKEKEIKSKYQQIVANIDYVKSIDKQEKDFEVKVKPGLAHIVSASILSVQNSIALALRKKTGEDLNSLREATEAYNNRHSG